MSGEFGGMLTRCWVYGQHSRAVGKLGVKVGDMVLVSAVKKSIFAPKPAVVDRIEYTEASE